MGNATTGRSAASYAGEASKPSSPTRSTRSPRANAADSEGDDPPALDEQTYKGRNVVERHFALIKQWRALATRYDELAITYRAAAVLAACITWLRA